jgi:hypothetical protein
LAHDGHRVFLLSPADTAATRARRLADPAADHELARRFQREGAPLGEVFAFISSLYFRGKLAYASAFAKPPAGAEGVLVITPSAGLQPPGTRIGPADLVRHAQVPVDPAEERYRRPLLRDAEALARTSGSAEVVLLGSVASAKYADLLAPLLGERLVFPADFVGRGDMSRGGLLLRCVEERRELRYVPVIGAQRHGARPARLPPKAR